MVDFEVGKNHCHKTIQMSSWVISLQQAQQLTTDKRTGQESQ